MLFPVVAAIVSTSDNSEALASDHVRRQYLAIGEQAVEKVDSSIHMLLSVAHYLFLSLSHGQEFEPVSTIALNFS